MAAHCYGRDVLALLGIAASCNGEESARKEQNSNRKEPHGRVCSREQLRVSPTQMGFGGRIVMAAAWLGRIDEDE